MSHFHFYPCGALYIDIPSPAPRCSLVYTDCRTCFKDNPTDHNNVVSQDRWPSRQVDQLHWSVRPSTSNISGLSRQVVSQDRWPSRPVSLYTLLCDVWLRNPWHNDLYPQPGIFSGIFSHTANFMKRSFQHINQNTFFIWHNNTCTQIYTHFQNLSQDAHQIHIV